MARFMNLSMGLILLTALTTSAIPIELDSTIPLELHNEVRGLLLARDPPKALPEKALPGQLKFQPAMDFDTDGCYNTPAINAQGKIAPGLGHDNTGAAEGCRDKSDLLNNNVYVRTRCNHDWCAHVYAYYFEKDVAVQHVSDVGGHRHDWEHVIIFAKGGEAKIVAASIHKDFETRKVMSDVRWEGGTHAKIVYHKDGGTTHGFRFANKDDEKIENHLGKWFFGDLVDYHTGFPSVAIRDKLNHYDFGDAHYALKDSALADALNKARNHGAPGFNSEVDG